LARSQEGRSMMERAWLGPRQVRRVWL